MATNCVPTAIQLTIEGITYKGSLDSDAKTVESNKNKQAELTLEPQQMVTAALADDGVKKAIDGNPGKEAAATDAATDAAALEGATQEKVTAAALAAALAAASSSGGRRTRRRRTKSGKKSTHRRRRSHKRRSTRRRRH
jgi:hypothetical protein